MNETFNERYINIFQMLQVTNPLITQKIVIFTIIIPNIGFIIYVCSR